MFECSQWWWYKNVRTVDTPYPSVTCWYKYLLPKLWIDSDTCNYKLKTYKPNCWSILK